MAEASIVGRDREIELLTEAIEDAAKSRGSVWYLTGEPGIGKSRLAEEVGRLARERGMGAFWGRCWEAGGAPAYWPWVQVLRAVLRTAEPGQVDPHRRTLSQILPELRGSQEVAESAELAPEPARFQLMDAVSNTLADAAQRLPMVVVLEDLHVADVSTVLMLKFLTATVRHQPLLLVGTFREVDLAAAPAGPELIRAAQEGQRLSLERLTEAEVEEFLRASGERPDGSLVHALYRTTDGHPLFLVEVARLRKTQGSAGLAAQPPIPRSVRVAIRERLATISSKCLRTLRCGAVVGREFDIGLLESCYGDELADYVDGAQEATDAAILVEIAPQRYRFVHFLIRELVYEAIPNGDRATAHARLAGILESDPSGDMPRWSEIAHHLVAAGKRRPASGAFRKAGAQALEQLAFEEAVHAYREALRIAEAGGDMAPREHIELLLDLAHAQSRSGDVAGGKQTCIAAASKARAEGDAELLAKAALEHGMHLIYATVDPDLVSLLEEALEALEASDGALRARVMARLAAALQPAEDPEGPMALARKAIAMARRLDDPETLLDTLRNGGSAMVDLGDLEERIALDREHAVLAEELGNLVEALRGNLRSAMDYLELQRLDDAFRAVHACERIAEELDHPAYAWLPAALKALRALWEGDLEAAETLIEHARSLGEQGSDPNASIVHAMQKTRLLQYRGDFEQQLPLLEKLDGHWSGTDVGRTTVNVIVGAEHVAAGRLDLALRGFDGPSVQKLLRLGDHTLHLCVAKLAIAANDRELAEQLHRGLLVTREQLVTGGILYMTLEGPTSWALASISRFLGNREEATEHYEHALTVAQRTGGRPVHALIAFELAQHLKEASESTNRDRALELARLAEEQAEEIGMAALHSEAAALVETLHENAQSEPVEHKERPTLTMTRAGDSWSISYGNVEFHLKDVRGVRLLAKLVDEPGREFHVLDLSSRGRAPAEARDRGDSGEILDEEARRQYRARVMALREELEQAETWNDPGRAARAREELEIIEKEISRAVGLGGRERRSGSAAERARVNVQRRIRDAISRIESYHPELAEHLDRAVRTGMYCVYEP